MKTNQIAIRNLLPSLNKGIKEEEIIQNTIVDLSGCKKMMRKKKQNELYVENTKK